MATARYPRTRPVPAPVPAPDTPRQLDTPPWPPPLHHCATPKCPDHDCASCRPRTCTFSGNTTQSTSAMGTMIPQLPPLVICSMNATYHSLSSAMTPAPMTHHLTCHLRLTTYSEITSDAPAKTTASIKRCVSIQPTSSSSSQGL
jgi:hypothetical protein